MQALECLIGEEAQPSIGDDPQHGGREAMVEGPQPLLPGDADKNVKDVAVPARTEGPEGGLWTQLLPSVPMFLMCL